MNIARLFAEVFQDDVSAEAETHQRDLAVSLLEGMIDHKTQVSADSAVIGSQKAVVRATAAPAIPGEGIPISFLQGERHSSDILRLRVSLKSMANDGEALVTEAGPVKIEEIAVREFETFSLISKRRNPPEESGENS